MNKKKKIYCVELDTVYDSISRAAEELGMPRTTISRALDKEPVQGLTFVSLDPQMTDD